MAPDGETPTREERLAAKLRENLHRRKQQARALSETAATPSQTTAEKLGGDAPDNRS